MEPITREEYYLAKIAGTWQGKTLEPVTIEEYYLATMAGDYSGNTPQPVTRLQYYMAKAAGVWGGSIPAPVTRLEYYWAAIANGEGTVFQPVTREEHLLALVADAYSVVLTVVTGNPALLEGVKGSRFTSLAIHGKSSQGRTTGAQLLDINNLELASSCQNNANVVDGGLSKRNDDVACPDRYLIDVIPNTIYTLSASDFVGGATVQISDLLQSVESESVVDVRIFKGSNQIEFNSNKYNQLTFSFFSGTVNTEFKASYIMLNSGSTALPWEPYTGGAPSPSPSYPQEIESAGQSGEIGVDVCGGNLLQLVNGNIGEYINISDGIITIKSGAKGRRNFIQIPETIFNPNKYTMSVVPLDNIINDGTLQIAFGIQETPEIYRGVKLRAEWYFGGSAQVGNGVTTTEVTNKITAKYLNVDIVKGNFTGQRFKLMLNLGSTALPYEPYKPAQKLIIPTPDGLPGIPVSSGGNYTDEKGQQWVADEIDLAKGEKVQWIEKLDLKSLSWAKQSRMSNAGGFWFSSKIKSASLFGLSVKGTISNIGICKNPYTDVGDYVWTLTNEGNSEVRIGFTDSMIDTLEKLTNLLNSLPEAYAMYCLAEPIRTPLPPETIAAYKKLHTYSPTTTVINDAGAGMSVGYKKAK